MTNTKADILNSCYTVFPGMNTATAVNYFDYTNREIVSQVHVLASDYETINSISNGVKVYALASNVVGVYTCRYQNSSATNDFSEMVETSLETIEQDDRSQLKRTGTPRQFAMDGGSLFVHPTPDTNSVNGYPSLILRVDRATTLGNSNTLPSDVPTHDAWRYGVLKRYAADVGDPKAELYENLFDRAMAKLHRYHHTKSRYTGPMIRGNAFFNKPRVR